MISPREVIDTYVADIAQHLPIKDRTDIACELHALLSDGLRARAEEARRPADEAMARAFAAEFGRPDQVAARYRPAGLTIIPPERSVAFLQIAITGVVLQWAIGVAVALVNIKSGEPVSIALQKWFFSVGLGAFWWPGFLVMCGAGAAWLAKRRSTNAVDGGSKMTPDKMARIGASFGLPITILFAVFYAAPGWFVGHIAPAGFDTSGFTYTDEFRVLRLPALLVYMTANVVLLGSMAIKGHDSHITRRLAIAIGLIGIAVMTWCVFGGPMFMIEGVDKLVRLILAIIVFFALVDLAQKIGREIILMR